MNTDGGVKPIGAREASTNWSKHEIGGGRFVYLVAEQGDDAFVYDDDMQSIGSAFFLPMGDEDDGYVVAGIHVDERYQKKGIATALITEFAFQNNDASIYFRPDTGATRDDGTHLTIEGMILAKSMIGRNLAFWLPAYGDDDRAD
ncbi:GNAT family N-acetyltransferase [Stenotrophomonas rhizophila]